VWAQLSISDVAYTPKMRYLVLQAGCQCRDTQYVIADGRCSVEWIRGKVRVSSHRRFSGARRWCRRWPSSGFHVTADEHCNSDADGGNTRKEEQWYRKTPIRCWRLDVAACSQAWHSFGQFGQFGQLVTELHRLHALCTKWSNQLRDTPYDTLGDIWRSAIRRGHCDGAMQRSSLPMRLWWWWWWRTVEMRLLATHVTHSVACVFVFLSVCVWHTWAVQKTILESIWGWC